MLVNLSLLLSSLYLGIALASPSSPHPGLTRARLNHIRRDRASQPLQKSPHSPNSISHLSLIHDNSQNLHGTYSSNWAGAVIDAPPQNATYTYVSATITVPTPTPTASGDTSYQAASAWVGIDGDTYTTAMLQTGVDIYVIDGVGYTDAWYEWYPNFALYYDEFAVNPGDVLVASVNVTDASGKKGVCIVENRSTGASVTKTVSAPKSTATVVGMNAEWVVEDFASGGDAVPFVGFREVKFEGCVARDGAGVEYGLEDATSYDLVVDDVVAASTEVLDNGEMIVRREGL